MNIPYSRIWLEAAAAVGVYPLVEKLGFSTAIQARVLLFAVVVAELISSWYSDSLDPEGRVKRTLVSWSRTEADRELPRFAGPPDVLWVDQELEPNE